MKKTVSLVLVLALGLGREIAKADFVFGTPTNLSATVNTSFHEAATGISPDGLSLFLDSNRSGGFDVWVTRRARTDDDWGSPEKLVAPISTNSWDGTPSLSADGLSLYFCSERPGGSGGNDIWVSTRANLSDAWGEPVNLGSTVNSPNQDWTPNLSADGLSLYFCSDRPEGAWDLDLWVTTRATASEAWGEPVNLGPTVNSSAFDMSPTITPDGLVLFFTSTRAGGRGERDLWMTSRPTTSDLWQEPVNLGPPINTSAMDTCTVISPDGSTLYFSSTRSGGFGGLDVWQVPIAVKSERADLNRDGKVNLHDLSKLAQYWDQDDLLVQIAPLALGDDASHSEHLAVLAQYWLTDFRLMAHWKLDETEGFIAHDSIRGKDGSLVGTVWQPTGGKVDGALEFDGEFDFVTTPFVLDPAGGPFSIFAWIKGGEPGQVIVSQANGTGLGRSWLCADSSDGKFMSELRAAAQADGSIMSQVVITDDIWHHLGFAWDGAYRHLYVDGTQVAKDSEPLSGLESADGGLYFGAANTFAPDTCWRGFIDDVRIYDCALSAEEIEELGR